MNALSAYSIRGPFFFVCMSVIVIRTSRSLRRRFRPGLFKSELLCTRKLFFAGRARHLRRGSKRVPGGLSADEPRALLLYLYA